MQEFIQPIHKHEDGLINTYRNKLIDYNNLTPDMICLDDMAKGVSNICRFGGQIEDFYSVAQHTLLVWLLSPSYLKPAALLHDLPEAFLGDVVKPLKNLLGEAYRKFERKFEEVIFAKYGVDIAMLELIKPYDMQALEIENNYFRFGKLDLLQKQYEINEIIAFDTPYRQLLTLLREHFMQRELFYKP